MIRRNINKKDFLTNPCSLFFLVHNLNRPLKTEGKVAYGAAVLLQWLQRFYHDDIETSKTVMDLLKDIEAELEKKARSSKGNKEASSFLAQLNAVREANIAPRTMQVGCVYLFCMCAVSTDVFCCFHYSLFSTISLFSVKFAWSSFMLSFFVSLHVPISNSTRPLTHRSHHLMLAHASCFRP